MNQQHPAHQFVKQPLADMRNRSPAHYHGQSGRLKFRPFAASDASVFAELTSHAEVQKTDLCFHGETTVDAAQDIIRCYQQAWNDQDALFFSIRLKPNDRLIGSISLTMTPAYQRAELGFWIGRDFWFQGFATEAAHAILEFAFHELNLHRVHAQHLSNNPASGKIMQKCGMRYEGCLRQHVCKGSDWHDMHLYGFTRSEYHDYSQKLLRQPVLT